MSNPSPQTFDTATIIRRVLFFLVLLTFTWLHLFPLFRGLDSPQAMEQAQIGRQIARGEGFTTKVIRPLAYYQSEKTKNSPVSFSGFTDNYHAPLNPLILGAAIKLVGGDKPAPAYAMEQGAWVYGLDRIVALVSTLFFLMAIGVSYLLIARVFDSRIATVTTIIMMLCDLFWKYSQSGQSQMLLLLLFSCGLFFTYRASEASQEGRIAMGPALLGAAFFVLMVLTKWLTIWIFFGYLIYAAFAFRPRGIVALSALALLLLAVAWPVARNIAETGHPLGNAFYTVYNGLGGSESTVMRTQNPEAEPFSADGMLLKIFGNMLIQAGDIIPFLGGILAAPLFFIALLHPFKRTSIAQFRWCLVLMWLFASLGMAIYGLDRSKATDANQLHILFAPIMAAYGLAFLSILWGRLDISSSGPFLRYAHFIIIILFSAAPLLLTLPDKIKIGTAYGKGGLPTPPYFPKTLNTELTAVAKETPEQPRIIVSDQPWGVAWYADRISLWIPRTVQGFEQLETKAARLNTPFNGILITGSSHGSSDFNTVSSQYGDFASLVYNGSVAFAVGRLPDNSLLSIYQQDPKLMEIRNRYPVFNPLLGLQIVYYGPANDPSPNP